jgi:Tfp pilus assembly protein PilF
VDDHPRVRAVARPVCQVSYLRSIGLLGLLLVVTVVSATAQGAPTADPVLAEVRVAEARLALARGDRGAALARLNEALAADPDHRVARRLRGTLRVEAHQFLQAEEDLAAVVEADPGDLQARRLLAAVYLAQKKHVWAARQYQALLEQTPGDGDAQLHYGYCLWHAGEQDEAAAALRRAERLGPAGVRQRAKVLLAVIHRAGGRSKEARRVLAEVRGEESALADLLRRDLWTAEGRAGRGLTLGFQLGIGYDSNFPMDTLLDHGAASEGLLVRLAARAR